MFQIYSKINPSEEGLRVDPEGFARNPNVSKWLGLYHHLNEVLGAISGY